MVSGNATACVLALETADFSDSPAVFNATTWNEYQVDGTRSVTVARFTAVTSTIG